MIEIHIEQTASAGPGLAAWAAVIAACAASLTFALNSLDRWFQHRREILRVEVQALERFSDEFKDLDERRNTIRLDENGRPRDQEEADRNMKDYWVLQLEQWRYFMRKILTIDTYATWSLHVFDHMRGRVARLPAGYTISSWERLGRSIARNHLRFRLMMELTSRVAAGAGHANDLSPAELLSVRTKLRSIALRCRRRTLAEIERELSALS